MKVIGIVRRVDILGRVVLPKELRKTFNIQEGDPIEIYVEGDKIILKKYQPACIFCGSFDEVSELFNKKICGKCRKEIRNVL